MVEREAVIKLAEKLRGLPIDPIPDYLLLRDVLDYPADHRQMRLARETLAASARVCRLADSQWVDGSWGRLHTKDSAVRQTIPTTEAGVERALAYGLDASHPVLEKAALHLQAILEGQVIIRDRAERNDKWLVGVELFASSTLARIRPQSEMLDHIWDKWFYIADRSLASGNYEPEAELDAIYQVFGVSARDSYFRLSSRYALSLLGSRSHMIPRDIEEALLTWIWTRESGIGYYGRQISQYPEPGSPGSIELWLRSLELLALFTGWRHIGQESIAWLWSRQNTAGYWDFGKAWSSGVVMPLSENWRKRGTRQLDWTVRVLSLLSTS